MSGDSVRLRLTLAAAAATTGVLIIAAVVLVVVFQRAEARHADDLDRGRLAELAALARQGEVPGLITGVGGDGFAQAVVDDRVIGASASVGDAAPVTSWQPGTQSSVRDIDDVPDDTESENYRVWGVSVDGPDGPVRLYVGTAREAIRESGVSLALTLAAGVPILLALAAGLLWVLIGRTLRPVAEAQARQRSFVADAAHELQSPLASYRAQLEVALRHPAGTDWPSTARELLAESDRMERLVRDLLFLARHDEAQPSARELVDLDDVVREEVSRLRPTTSLAVDSSGVSAAPVRCGREELARLVRNLLANAVRHARERVEVRCGVLGEEVVLQISDDGPGIASEQREEIFGRFVRGDAARHHGEGTGLGLPIARAIAQRHGGSVHVVDSVVGALLEVRLPAA